MLIIIAVVVVLILLLNQHKGISRQALKELAQNGALIIDVRRSDEYTSGHIKGAKHYPLNSIEEKMGKLPKNRDIIVYCLSGARSARAVSILKGNGFTRVFNGGGYAHVQAALGE